MSDASDRDRVWPPLPLDSWADTLDTLHRWSQVVGKVRLGAMPWVNHAWHVPLYVTTRGLSTGLVPHPTGGFEVAFDFHAHRLSVVTADGAERAFGLGPMSVAAFYEQTLGALREAGVAPDVWPEPVEIPGPVVPFPDDHAPRAYDAEAAHRHWRVLLQAHRLLTVFRSRFVGKASPVHWFWGAADLATTRFSGRPAPPHPGGAPNLADWVMREAYSDELSSAGFWPGTGLGEPAFYAYAYPEPPGFADAPVQPDAAYYHVGLGEFVLPYEAVRTAEDPDRAVLDFLQSTYEAAADGAEWDRAALERHLPPSSA